MKQICKKKRWKMYVSKKYICKKLINEKGNNLLKNKICSYFEVNVLN